MPPVPLGNRTKMESTAALLPKHGSRAMGFGTDCGGNRKQTNITHHKPRERRARRRAFKETDNAGFVVPLPVCVSNIRGERKKPFPSPARSSAGPQLFPQSPAVHKFTTMRAGEPLPKIKWRSGVRGCVSPGALPSPRAPPIHT